MTKKLYIKTYGCQMNVYDSRRMADLLRPLGYVTIDDPEGADLAILNTCHIREKAAEKVYSDLGRLRAFKEAREARGAGMLVAVAGCVAQAEGAEIMRRAPIVDMVLGPQAYQALPRMVEAARAHAPHDPVAVDFAAADKFDILAGENVSEGVTAFLTVQEGCDKFCAFCVVPYTRGAEISRPVDDIEAEARRLVGAGTREITLLGQNVNAYRGAFRDARGRAAPKAGDGLSLAGLIRRLAGIEGLSRIRYTTSHPRDMDEDLIRAHGEIEELMPYLHLPAQSGSDRILKAMNRGHSAKDYLDLVARVRAARPDIALSGDFIVGFPGETDRDFEATLALVSEVGYAQAFSFKYSPRPGTPAAEQADQVPEAVKAERLWVLQALLDRQQKAFNAGSVGAVYPVLFERPGRHPGQIVGRSPYLQPVHVEAPEALCGAIREVRIAAALPNSLAGRLEGGAERPAGRAA